MIVTVTANPSFDRTIELRGALDRGAVQRAAGTRLQAAGKGVNVSHALLHAGVPVITLVRADSTDPYVAELAAAVPAIVPIPAGAPVRTNLSLTEPDGTTTKINEPGPALAAHHGAALIAATVDACHDARWLVIAGSLPPGAPPSFLASLVRAVRSAHPGVKIAVDTSGPALHDLVVSGVGVNLIKPNAEELAELLGTDAALLETDPEAVARAARALRDQGVEAVLATLGAAGAVLVTPRGAWHATHPPVIARSTVGAGDSSLAGFVIADHQGADDPTCLARAVAYGAAAVALPGTTIPRPADTRPEEVAISAVSFTD